MSSDAGLRRSDWKGVTTTLCVDISESMATAETWGQVLEFVGSFLQGENGWDVDGTESLSRHICRFFFLICRLVRGNCILFHTEYSFLDKMTTLKPLRKTLMNT